MVQKSRIITWRGKKKTIAEWSAITGISITSIHRRLETGWSLDKAMTEPPQNRPYNRAAAFGEKDYGPDFGEDLL